jgi:DNA-binding NarL/FixJ family response regulator
VSSYYTTHTNLVSLKGYIPRSLRDRFTLTAKRRKQTVREAVETAAALYIDSDMRMRRMEAALRSIATYDEPGWARDVARTGLEVD